MEESVRHLARWNIGQRLVLRQARKSMTGFTKTCAARLATEEVPNSIDCLFVRR